MCAINSSYFIDCVFFTFVMILAGIILFLFAPGVNHLREETLQTLFPLNKKAINEAQVLTVLRRTVGVGTWPIGGHK